MMPSSLDFLRSLADEDLTHQERAVALLWWYGRSDPQNTRTAKEIGEEMETAGYAKQNIHRLRQKLEADPRVIKSDGGFRINISRKSELDGRFSGFSGPRRPEPSDSVLPLELFFDTRGYIERVVFQINAAYDNTLYDCCAIMCRRLIETLLIEVYELNGKADEIKDAGGNFVSYSRLRSHIESDTRFHMSREGRKGLESAKRLGDLSAHNRRYLATIDDIDRERDKLRVSSEELLRHAGLI